MEEKAHAVKEGVYYGWVIVLVSFITITVAFGILFTFSVFFVALLEEFGWSRAATASAYSLNMLVAGFSAPISGVLIDRIGPRKALPIGAFLLALGLFGSSRIQTLWEFHLFYGVIAALGIGFLGMVPHAAILSNWFIQARGTAIAIAFSGMGVGTFLFSPLSQYLISTVGWRAAFLVLAVLAALLLPLTALFQRGSPGEVGLLPESLEETSRLTTWAQTSRREWTISQALKAKPFWFLFVAFIFTPVSVFAVTTHQVAYLVDLGFSKAFAVGIYAVVGILSAPGQIVFGYLSDRIGRIEAATLGYISSVLGILALLIGQASSPWPFYLYALLFGLGFGSRGPVLSALVADIFRGRSYGTIYGLIVVGNGIGTALGPWLGGVVHDLMGSYSLAFWGAVLASGLACLSVWLTGPGEESPAKAEREGG